MPHFGRATNYTLQYTAQNTVYTTDAPADVKLFEIYSMKLFRILTRLFIDLCDDGNPFLYAITISKSGMLAFKFSIPRLEFRMQNVGKYWSNAVKFIKLTEINV